MNNMEKEFVPYELAVKLKALGFDEPCFAFYICKGHPVHIDEIRNGKCFESEESEGCLAPTFSQAFRWFRERYNLKSWVQEHNQNNYIYEIRPHKLTDYRENEVYVYEAHEQAELACLERLIDMITNKKIFDFVTEL
jgi:hypothetical protein